MFKLKTSIQTGVSSLLQVTSQVSLKSCSHAAAYRIGVGNVRPSGRIRPANENYWPARKFTGLQRVNITKFL